MSRRRRRLGTATLEQFVERHGPVVVSETHGNTTVAKLTDGLVIVSTLGMTIHSGPDGVNITTYHPGWFSHGYDVRGRYVRTCRAWQRAQGGIDAGDPLR